MNTQGETSLSIALLHHPVLNKKRQTIGSAVTNLDIHDIARMARTYGVAEYFIVSPFEDQHKLVEELLSHWQDGYGATYNPARKEALEIVRLAESFDQVVEAVTSRYQRAPLLVTTSAIQQEKCLEYRELRRLLKEDTPVLLLFGTAHGLAPEVIKTADWTLPPIDGGTEYNHLSVRSAASIIIDRLLGH